MNWIKNSGNFNPNILLNTNRYMKKSTTQILLIFFTAFAYAVIRYNIFGSVSWADIPAYILNKGFAFTIVGLIILFIYHKKNSNKEISDDVLNWLKMMILFHVIFSIILFNQYYFPKFFENGRMTFLSGLSILFGVSAFVYGLMSKRDVNMIMFLIFIMLHTLFMGFGGWLKPETWHGNMPPITLISFILLFAILILNKKKF